MNGAAQWTIAQLIDSTRGRLVRGRPTGSVQGITTDSRRLTPGQAFVALKGPRFDGHEFLDEVAHGGAACAIVSRVPDVSNGAARLPTILVPDSFSALADLARTHRKRFGEVIAITGSCGKTTTKDLLAHVLGGDAAVLKSAGTQNNHIGVPLTLLRWAPRHQRAVVELGTNHPGEIAALAAIACPTTALITNVGPAHLEFLGSLAGVRKEKLSLLSALPPEGTAIVPGDQLEVALEAPQHLAAGTRLVTFGMTERCDIQATDLQHTAGGMQFRLRDRYETWFLPMPGCHNVENALAAIATAWACGLPLSVVRERLATFQPMPLRSELLAAHGMVILNDCYNANPLSMARALETLRDLDVQRRVAVMGDMLELGEFAGPAHQAIGRLAGQLGIDEIVAVGRYAEHVAQGVRERRPDGVTMYPTVEAVVAELPGRLRSGDGVLIKGSRKLSLERLTEALVGGAGNGAAKS